MESVLRLGVMKGEIWFCGRSMAKYHGGYPNGFLNRIKRHFPLAHSVLHVCSGSLTKTAGGVRIDINPDVEPDIVADAQKLPIKDGTMDLVLSDPPYSQEYAEIYTYPLPSMYKILAESVRVCKEGGIAAMLHFIATNTPKGSERIWSIPIYSGPQMRVRTLNLFRKVNSLKSFCE